MPRCSVLIVEDDHSLAEIIAFSLQVAGFETYIASDGMQGYRSYFDHPTDWVVTDIEMPGLDGISMMQWIRALNPQVRAVYMSAALEEYRLRLDLESKNFSANILRKPFARTNLIKQLSARPADSPNTSTTPQVHD